MSEECKAFVVTQRSNWLGKSYTRLMSLTPALFLSKGTQKLTLRIQPVVGPDIVRQGGGIEISTEIAISQ